jgi:thioredoxin 1
MALKKILDCSAAWCGPCKALSTTFDKVSNMEKYKGIDFEKVDIDTDEGADVVEKFKIRSIPTLVLLDENGEELDKVFGNIQEDKLLETIDKHH